VPYSSSQDGFLRDGDCIALIHKQTGGSLSCDPFDPDINISVCESNKKVCARNLFQIVSLEKSKSSSKERTIIRWGESFQLKSCIPASAIAEKKKDSCNDENCALSKNGITSNTNLYLASCLKSERKVSPISHQQQIWLTKDKANYKTHWAANTPAFTKKAGYTRLLQKGNPILVGDLIVLQHCATKSMMSSSPSYFVSTDFGREYEVCGATKHRTGRVEVLRDEFRGHKTEKTNCKLDVEDTIWTIFIPQSRENSKHEDIYFEMPEIGLHSIIHKILFLLKQRGRLSFVSLRTHLLLTQGHDTSNDGLKGHKILKLKHMKQIFGGHEIHLNDENYKVLIEKFCVTTDPKGLSSDIDVIQLLEALRNESGESISKKRIITDIYTKLDKANIGYLEDSLVSKACAQLTNQDFQDKFGIIELDLHEVAKFLNIEENGTVSREGKLFPAFYTNLLISCE